MDSKPHEVTLEASFGDPQQVMEALHDLSDVFELFADRSREYGDHAFVLGSAGQYADMSRKFGKIKTAMWDKKPEQLTSESIQEVLTDMIGHCLLSLQCLRREGVLPKQRLPFRGEEGEKGDAYTPQDLGMTDAEAEYGPQCVDMSDYVEGAALSEPDHFHDAPFPGDPESDENWTHLKQTVKKLEHRLEVQEKQIEESRQASIADQERMRQMHNKLALQYGEQIEKLESALSMAGETNDALTKENEAVIQNLKAAFDVFGNIGNIIEEAKQVIN